LAFCHIPPHYQIDSAIMGPAKIQPVAYEMKSCI